MRLLEQTYGDGSHSIIQYLGPNWCGRSCGYALTAARDKYVAYGRFWIPSRDSPRPPAVKVCLVVKRPGSSLNVLSK